MIMQEEPTTNSPRAAMDEAGPPGPMETAPGEAAAGRNEAVGKRVAAGTFADAARAYEAAAHDYQGAGAPNAAVAAMLSAGDAHQRAGDLLHAQALDDARAAYGREGDEHTSAAEDAAAGD